MAASFDDLQRVPSISRACATAIAERTVRDGDEIVRRTRELGGVLLAPGHAGFPDRLREIPEPPGLLFAAGRAEMLQTHAVAVVGSRDHSPYGAAVCRRLAAGAARAGVTVVSGMARGLDAAAHEAVLDIGGATVGVLGNGLGVVYPAANRALYQRMMDAGCLITEFLPGERPNAGSFPRRNRLISGLAKLTVVVEARGGSGALITADCALNQGREVGAVPGPITSPTSVGTNRLIQLGAKSILETRDILEEYGITVPEPSTRPPAGLTPEEDRVLAAVGDGPRDVDAIADGAGLNVSEVMTVLTGLELRGIVRPLVGGLVRRAC